MIVTFFRAYYTETAVSYTHLDVYKRQLIYSISGYDFEKSTMNVGQNMVFVIVYFVLLFLMGFVVAFLLRLKKPQKNFYQMMMLFSNIGFVDVYKRQGEQCT